MIESDKANFDLHIHSEQIKSVIGTSYLLLKENTLINLEWLDKQIPFYQIWNLLQLQFSQIQHYVSVS